MLPSPTATGPHRGPARRTRNRRALLLLCPALALAPAASAQQAIWTDSFNGGVVTGSFSLGDQASGIGIIQKPLPAGATIRHATLYAVQIGGEADASVSFLMDTIPVTFDNTTAGPAFATTYGQAVLHARDMTTLLDAATPLYVMDLSSAWSSFKEFMLVTEYELPGAGPITVDIFHCGADSQLEESYAIHASHPMSTGQPIAFGTMAAYALSPLHDYEEVAVNGTYLGKLHGRDYNAAANNYFGACATFHYANGIFEGIGDDNTDMAINGSDVLSDLSTLVPNGTQDLHITYAHSPTTLPAQQQDNLVNLIILAYANAPCPPTAGRLGPDTLLCPGASLTLDASLQGATTLWQDGSTSPTLTVTGPGTYAVQWASPECTFEPDTIVVGLVPLPAMALGPDLALCPSDSVPLGPDPVAGATYAWSDGDTTLPRTVSAPGTYILTASMEGCSTADSIAVAAESRCAFGAELPNVFTPNGDGLNALFRPISISGVARLSITIYDRWGNVVFTSHDLHWAWDGRSPAGQPLAEGVYFWTLELTPERSTATRAAKHGTVMLLR